MKSLAVKYRPQNFNEILGQEVVVRILQKQLDVKDFPHCYLFTGPSDDTHQ